MLPKGDSNLVVTVHNYDPFYFTHQGASWTKGQTATKGIIFPGPPKTPLSPAPTVASNAAVVGWKPSEVKMGDYADYSMNEPASGSTVAGVCHARGENANLPPVWLIYITVANLDESIARCRKLGGTVLSGPRDMGSYGRLAVIKDPAGAVAALCEARPGK